MSILSNLNVTEEIQEDKDVLPSGGSFTWESGIYEAKVDMAYVEKSKGGATAINLRLKNAEGKELREKLWVASGDAKGNKPYYTTSEGEKRYLPGFSLFRSLTLMTNNVEPGSVSTEERVIKVYSPEERKEVATTVDCIVDLIDKEITVGVLNKIVDRTENDGSGNYVPTGETRQVNEISKFFHNETKLTVVEAMEGKEKGEYITRWEEKYKGEVIDESTKNVAKPAGGTVSKFATGNASANSPAKPTKSLFTTGS